MWHVFLFYILILNLMIRLPVIIHCCTERSEMKTLRWIFAFRILVTLNFYIFIDTKFLVTFIWILKRGIVIVGFSMLWLENNFRRIHCDTGEKQPSCSCIEHSLHIVKWNQTDKYVVISFLQMGTLLETALNEWWEKHAQGIMFEFWAYQSNRNKCSMQL